MQREALLPEISVSEMSLFPAAPTLQNDAERAPVMPPLLGWSQRQSALLLKDRALTLCFSLCLGDKPPGHSFVAPKFPGYLEGKGQSSKQGSRTLNKTGPKQPEKPHIICQTCWRAAISDLQKQSLGCLSSLN